MISQEQARRSWWRDFLVYGQGDMVLVRCLKCHEDTWFAPGVTMLEIRDKQKQHRETC